ncbi:MAG: glutathione S-transferase N-terminal domain-containing protein [Alcanivoracaceae bacterium]|jgi:glutathione S-transferase|nr:glutathione S-transferase N-terminal domain-containing protein [Alcanivoracaceae bacterium]
MKLITSLTSPFGRKIRILLQEKNISCEILEDVPWNADTITAQYNPLGKIPVLVRDDNSTLFDSRVIAHYLDSLGAPALIPAKGEARMQVLRWEALADGISDAAAAVFIERRRDASLQSQDWIYRQLGKVHAGLKEAERALDGNTCTGRFTLADIAMIAALDYVQLRLGADLSLLDYPRLQAFGSNLQSRVSVTSTRPPA